MSLSTAQLDRLPFGVLEVMTSNHVRVSRILRVPSHSYISVNLVACPSWLSLAKLHGITPLMPSVLVQLGFQPVTSCFTQFNTLLTD